MAKKPISALWWCIQSPQYGLLPFTCHTSRKGCVRRFELWGADRFKTSDPQVSKMWKQSRKEGFRCLRIRVRPSTRGVRG